MIPYGRQDISEADSAAVLEVLHSDWLTQGPTGPRFEAALARYVDAPHVVVVSNATAALHLTYLAMGMRPGKLVWTTPNTFVATANAALYCGAGIDFVDIDPQSYCLSMDALEAKLMRTRQFGDQLPDLVAAVHFAGQSCDMQKLFALGQQYGFRIVEDASHAIGADADGGKVGHCRYSDVCIFSFHPVKIITTGEGGAITTKDAALAQRLVELRSHGITRDQNRMVGTSEGAWYYQQISLGYNYRLTDLQSALGLSQLKRIDAFIARRRALAAHYDKLLAALPLVLPMQHPDGQSAFHLYPVTLKLEQVHQGRAAVFDALRKAGIGVNVHYIPVHLQPYYQELGFKPGDFPQAESYYDAALTLPLFAGMTDRQQDEVVSALSVILNGDKA
jgi:UDP-4-amino-4,6-dideoxy-N-acetyl-beta-L-altrosamine transaminase